jgi:hypothetical protein
VGKTGLGKGKQDRVREGRGKKKPRRQGSKQTGVALGKKGKGEEMEKWEGTAQRKEK